MRTMALSLFAAVALFLSSISSAQSPLPRTLSYQGIFSDTLGNPKPDGFYNFTFVLYGEQQGGTPLWSEQKALAVTKGHFHTLLGDQTAFPPSLTFADQYWLGIRVGTEAEMAPRIPLTAAAYSLHAAKADTALFAFKVADTSGTVTLGDGEVKTNNIADSAVTSEKIRIPLTLGNPGSSADGPPVLTISTYKRTGLWVRNLNGEGIHLESPAGIGFYAEKYTGGTDWTIFAHSGWESGQAIFAEGYRAIVGSSAAIGVEGDGYGQYGGIGVFGSGAEESHGVGVFGKCVGEGCYAGKFQGNVTVTGMLTKGGGAFKIDHPLDPANKYLLHSFVESPDMKNIYDGVVTLDAQGNAEVALPDYFEVLNKDFRYQLTCVGGYAQVYIASEIQNNMFKIAGGTPGLKVSWQVTGTRQDAFANAHRIVPEQDKPADEKGKYLYPDEQRVSQKLGVDYEVLSRHDSHRQQDVKLSNTLEVARKARQQARDAEQTK